jgi:hypothetical protein
MDDLSKLQGQPAELQPGTIGLASERAAFERWASVRGLQLARQENTPEHYDAWVTNTLWNGWQARADYERTRCRYPQCVENEDERCPRWLTGDCEGPNSQ